MSGHFYGREQFENYTGESLLLSEYAEVCPDIRTPLDLYNILLRFWCADTCAPRMRDKWTKDNPTLGQCSITAFLVQDLFGGEVYGVLREGGNYHCYNKVVEFIFDLTSEQFGDEKLVYDCSIPQSREVHFAKQEKYLRYEFLKEKVLPIKD